MNSTAVTRRGFLGASAGVVATLAVGALPDVARANPRPEPTGVLYGRAGKRGIPAGTRNSPSRGEVILLDGTPLEATHVNNQRIRPGKSILLSADVDGRWSVLYAEL